MVSGAYGIVARSSRIAVPIAWKVTISPPREYVPAPTVVRWMPCAMRTPITPLASSLAAWWVRRSTTLSRALYTPWVNSGGSLVLGEAHAADAAHHLCRIGGADKENRAFHATTPSGSTPALSSFA